MGAASGGDPSTGWSRPRLRLRAGLATGTASAMPWQEIAGQDRAVRLLRGALERGQPHHAYLLAGPAGIGKELLARLFAQAANCEAVSGEQPCGSCAACAAIARGNHPDVMRVLPQSEAVARGLISRADLEGAPSREIRVDEVRALSRRLALVAARGRRKVAVVAPAEALNERAQNTLLKTLEELPPSTTFLLVSEQPDALLATVRSRCARVQLAPLPEKVLVEQLIKRGARWPSIPPSWTAAASCSNRWRPPSPPPTSATCWSWRRRRESATRRAPWRTRSRRGRATSSWPRRAARSTLRSCPRPPPGSRRRSLRRPSCRRPACAPRRSRRSTRTATGGCSSSGSCSASGSCAVVELDELLEAAAQGKGKPVYLVEGDEFLARGAARELAEALVPETDRVLNLISLDASAGAREVTSNVMTVAMFAAPKAVVVEGADAFAEEVDAGRELARAR